MDSKFVAIRESLPANTGRVQELASRDATRNWFVIAAETLLKLRAQAPLQHFPDRCLLRDLQYRPQRIGHKSVHVPITMRAIDSNEDFEIAYTHNVRSKVRY
jgi:hypothetical protein